MVEDRYSALFKLPFAAGARAPEALAEAQARFPSIPIVFCESRPLAQEWTYRWLGACLAELEMASASAEIESTFAAGPEIEDEVPTVAAKPSTKVIRSWAREAGLEVPDKGRIPAAVVRAWQLRETTD